MNYEIAKKLKGAGFDGLESPFHVGPKPEDIEFLPNPTLEELIAACDGQWSLAFFGPNIEGDKWLARKYVSVCGEDHATVHGSGNTLVEAVANLWLELNKKQPEEQDGHIKPCACGLAWGHAGKHKSI